MIFNYYEYDGILFKGIKYEKIINRRHNYPNYERNIIKYVSANKFENNIIKKIIEIDNIFLYIWKVIENYDDYFDSYGLEFIDSKYKFINSNSKKYICI